MKVQFRRMVSHGILAAGLLLSFLSQGVRADILDPSTLHIGTGAGTPCATGGCFLWNNEVNGLGSGSTLDIYQQSSGAPTLNQPLLLILAVPNDTTGSSFSASPINAVTYCSSYSGQSTCGATWSSAFATTGTYGLTPVSPSTGSNGYFGAMSSSDIYTVLGLQQPADNSNNFTNLTSYESHVNGITASSFGLYVYALSGGGLQGGGLVNVTFNSGSLPLGTYAVAYGFQGSDCSNTHCYVYDTPFTQSGLTTNGPPPPVPEPTSLALTALALAGNAVARRRRSATTSAAQ